jgi:DNA-binding MarR family transcriptional regulator
MSMMSSTMPAGCWDLDLATGMLSLCRYSRTMFGLGPDSCGTLTESEWASRLHPDDLTAVRHALTACLVHQVPYAERFRTIHPDGSVQLVLGIGGPVEDAGEHGRFAGWNFDVAAAGRMAGEWISTHPEALSAAHLFSILPSAAPCGEAPSDMMPPHALLERAESILRVRRSRERLFGRAMIGEPAFDLLLHLYVRAQEGEASLNSLAKTAAIPYSSASRWISYLADKGLVERRKSESDRRVILVDLTPSGRAVLDEFLVIQ